MKWKNPPESTAIAQRHTQWRQIADTLRANPGNVTAALDKADAS